MPNLRRAKVEKTHGFAIKFFVFAAI